MDGDKIHNRCWHLYVNTNQGNPGSRRTHTFLCVLLSRRHPPKNHDPGSSGGRGVGLRDHAGLLPKWWREGEKTVERVKGQLQGKGSVCWCCCFSVVCASFITGSYYDPFYQTDRQYDQIKLLQAHLKVFVTQVKDVWKALEYLQHILE